LTGLLFIAIVSISFLVMENYLDGYGKENCKHCGLNRTEQGHDGCIGELTGVMNACCGHGQKSTLMCNLITAITKKNQTKYYYKAKKPLSISNSIRALANEC